MKLVDSQDLNLTDLRKWVLDGETIPDPLPREIINLLYIHRESPQRIAAEIRYNENKAQILGLQVLHFTYSWSKHMDIWIS